MGQAYEAGLQEVGDGLYACLQEDLPKTRRRVDG
jgi:hypothetical protein